MPHKHKRKRDDDTSNFDLAPTARAKPLPAYKVPSIFTSDQDGPSNKRRKPNAKAKTKSQDDTPKAFARMLAWQAAGKRPSGLDDGTTATKATKKQKQKQKSKQPTSTSAEETTSEPQASSKTKVNPTNPPESTPKIRPGESLSAFSLRVNQSLPLSQIKSTSTSTQPNIPSDIRPQTRLTKHNKKLQRLIATWRDTDAKLKASREEDDLSSLDSGAEEETHLWDSVKLARSDRKGKKKAIAGRLQKGEDDPWRELEKRRRLETKQKSLQDVVQAPPALKKVKSKFKSKEEDFAMVDGAAAKGKNEGWNDGAVLGVDVKDVPNSVGSLRKREELSGTRRAVIEGYRKIKGRKGSFKERGVVGMPKGITT